MHYSWRDEISSALHITTCPFLNELHFLCAFLSSRESTTFYMVDLPANGHIIMLIFPHYDLSHLFPPFHGSRHNKDGNWLFSLGLKLKVWSISPLNTHTNYRMSTRIFDLDLGCSSEITAYVEGSKKTMCSYPACTGFLQYLQRKINSFTSGTVFKRSD